MNKLTTMGAIVLMLISIFAVSVSADAPTFDPAPADQTVAEGMSSAFTLSATDGGSETVTYSKVSGPAWVTVNSTTGTVTMAPGYTGAASSPYEVTVSASHGADPLDLTEESFDITVSDANPRLSAIPDQMVTEGATLEVSVTATAPDMGTEFTVSGPASSFIEVTEISATRATLTVAPGFTAAALSPYTVTVLATDGDGSSDSTTFQLSVSNVNPRLSAIPDQMVMEGDTLQVPVTATAPDPSTTFTVLGAASSFISVTRNSATSATLTVAPGFTAATSSPYTVTVRAEDSDSSDETTFTLTVSDENPKLSAIPDQTVAEGATLEVSVTATAPDASTTFTVSGTTPSFVTVTKNSATRATLTVAPGFSDAGPYTVTVLATDGDGSSDSTTFQLTVIDETPTSTLLVVSDVTLGSDGQVRSNPAADKSEDQNVFTTGSFTVTNNGPDQITDIMVTQEVLGRESDYNLTVTGGVPSTLAPGASATVSVRARVPEDLAAVDADARKVAPLVAHFTVDGTLVGTPLSTTNDVRMETENQLDIKRLKVCVNGSCETVNDGDKVDNLKPGDSIDVTFKVKNRFRENGAEDIEIKDVEAFVLVTDSNFDVEEDDVIGDINANKEEEVTLSFVVEDDAVDGIVSMSAWVEAEDENGAKHGELFEIDLEVNRERREVSLRNVRLEPDELSCTADGDQTVVLSLELQNTGRSDEDDVTIEIENTVLGITNVERSIVIDENDRDRKTYTLRVPSDAESGVYALSVKAFTRRDDLSHSKDMLLTVPACAASEPVASEPVVEGEDEAIVVVTGPAPDTTTPLPASADATATPVSSSFGTSSASSGMYVALLVAIIIVLVIIGVMLVNALAKRN